MLDVYILIIPIPIILITIFMVINIITVTVFSLLPWSLVMFNGLLASSSFNLKLDEDERQLFRKLSAPLLSLLIFSAKACKHDEKV